MKKIYLIALMGLLLCVSCNKKETDPEVIAMRGLVNRVIPEFSDQIQLERLNDTIDRYEFESVDNKIVIRGNNANSMAVGLNRYLKYYCHAEFPWFMEEALEMPATLPMVPEKVSETARVPERFFLNYCTFGYTMPCWSFRTTGHVASMISILFFLASSYVSGGSPWARRSTFTSCSSRMSSWLMVMSPSFLRRSHSIPLCTISPKQ